MRRRFVDWLTGYQSLTSIASELVTTRRTLTAWFEPLWYEALPVAQRVDVTGHVLIVDGVQLARGASVLVGRTVQRVASWVFTAGESTVCWLQFTATVVGTPSAVVLDGRAGLLVGVTLTWPAARIQRCHFHLLKRARILLTKQPKSEAGQVIRRLLLQLKDVQSRRQKRRWVRAYHCWERRFGRFLDERTTSDRLTPTGRRRWWYTHKHLRGIRSLVRNALPHMFTYVRHPEIPRTTNHVEGGLNSTLAELIHRHRGLPVQRKQRLAALFFASKQ